MGGPSETPRFTEEETGPERGRNLLQVTQQGQAQPGREARSPNILPRTFPNVLPPLQGAQQDGPPSPENIGLLRLDLTALPSPHPTGGTASASLPVCVPEFPEPKGSWIVRQRVRRFTRTFKIICADRDLVSQVKGDL